MAAGGWGIRGAGPFKLVAGRPEKPISITKKGFFADGEQ